MEETPKAQVQIGDRILVKTKSVLSFTGVLLESDFVYTNINSIVLKTSDSSRILTVIPKNEIIRVFTMDGEGEI